MVGMVKMGVIWIILRGFKGVWVIGGAWVACGVRSGKKRLILANTVVYNLDIY